MKALFLHFYDLASHSGVSKKVTKQVSALESCGVITDLCYVEIDSAGVQRRVCNNDVVGVFGAGYLAKFYKWFCFESLTEYIIKNRYDFIYIRSFYNTNPPLLRMLKRIKLEGIIILLEIPTYPYDKEVYSAPLKYQFLFFLNRIYRCQLAKYTDFVVTFTDLKKIHGIKTINISNGIDFDSVAVNTKEPTKLSDPLVMTGVADINIWHGFDRLIRGLACYYKEGGKVNIIFNIVGEGNPKFLTYLKNLVKQTNLGGRVFFLGYKSGSELDDIMNQTDFGIASLARHSNILPKNWTGAKVIRFA